jgi:hypothetical protein
VYRISYDDYTPPRTTTTIGNSTSISSGSNSSVGSSSGVGSSSLSLSYIYFIILVCSFYFFGSILIDYALHIDNGYPTNARKHVRKYAPGIHESPQEPHIQRRRHHHARTMNRLGRFGVASSGKLYIYIYIHIYALLKVFLLLDYEIFITLHCTYILIKI